MRMLGHFDKYGSLNVPILWGRKDTMIYGDLFIAWQTHCTLQVTTVGPHSSGPVSGGLINCELV